MSVKISDSLKRKWPVGVDPGIGRAVRHMRQTGTPLPPEQMFVTRRTA
jgi:hypothetical protein